MPVAIEPEQPAGAAGLANAGNRCQVGRIVSLEIRADFRSLMHGFRVDVF